VIIPNILLTFWTHSNMYNVDVGVLLK